VRIRLLAFLIGALALAVGCSSSPNDVRYVRASGSMPALSGRTLTDGQLSPSDYRGKVVVVNFWNQDCPPCRTEMPLLERESRRLRARGVAVIGILYVGGNWPDDPNAARAFLRQVGVSYPNLLDERSELAAKFRIAGIPSTIVVDRTGQMRFRVLGRLRSGQLDELLSMLDRGTD
jgi:thiol-disulfide isomerase/thioredoxin